jgi:hypothetical protein
MTFEKETCLQKITLEPLANIKSPRVLMREIPNNWRYEYYHKHWINDIPHDIQ